MSVVSPVLVGRTHELETLERALQAAESGVGRCLMITGEAGVGKSRLLSEARLRAADRRFLTLQGNCFEHDEAFPYAPWIDLLHAFLLPRSSEEIHALLGPLASEFAPLLPGLAPILPQPHARAVLDREAKKRRRFEAFVQFFAHQSQRQPLLVALEDLHWSDETSLELFHLCVRRLTENPIVFFGTCRREDLSPQLTRILAPFDRARLSREISLSPLPRDQVATLMRVILGSERPMGHDFLDVVMSLSEGNPFYVEEILKALVEQGGTYDRGTEWERHAVANLHIPPSVQDVVRSRVESLSLGARAIIEIASVAGARFDFALLRAAVDADEANLLHSLKELINAQFLVEQSRDQFAFRHALAREAIYRQLLGRERRNLHQHIGEALERLHPSPPDRAGRIAELAYHFHQAGVWEKALRYSEQAGEKARSLHAPRESLDHFNHALDSMQHLSLAPSFELLRARASSHETLGNFEQAREDFQAALEIAERSGDLRAEWQATLDLGSLWAAKDYSQSGVQLLRALDLARQVGDRAILGHSLNRVGNWHLNRDELSEARQYHEEALLVFRELNDQQGMAETLELLGVTSYASGHVVQGIDYTEQAIHLHRQREDRQGLINSLIHLPLAAQFDTEVSAPGDVARLLPPGDEALHLARDIGWLSGEAVVSVNLAHCLIPSGDYARALDTLSIAASIGEEIDHRIVIIISHWLLGQLYHGLLDFVESARQLEQAVALAEASQAGLYLRVSMADLALACISQNDLGRAAALLATVPSEGPLQSRHVRACWNARAELALAQGDPTLALQIADELISSSPDIGRYGPRGIPRISHLRGRALAALGRLDDAEAALVDACAGAQEQGRRPLTWRIHASLGRLFRSHRRGEEAKQEFAKARGLIEDLALRLPDAALREKFRQHAQTLVPSLPLLSPKQEAKQQFEGLTAREREVAALVARGKSNAAIAETLVTSKRTVEKHVGSILSKLGMSSRAQVVAWAIEKGLVKGTP